MTKTVKLKNIGSENLAFAGIPLIEPDETFEVSAEQAEVLLKNVSVKMVEDEKKSSKSFKAVESE